MREHQNHWHWWPADTYALANNTRETHSLVSHTPCRPKTSSRITRYMPCRPSPSPTVNVYNMPACPHAHRCTILRLGFRASQLGVRTDQPAFCYAPRDPDATENEPVRPAPPARVHHSMQQPRNAHQRIQNSNDNIENRMFLLSGAATSRTATSAGRM